MAGGKASPRTLPVWVLLVLVVAAGATALFPSPDPSSAPTSGSTTRASPSPSATTDPGADSRSPDRSFPTRHPDPAARGSAARALEGLPVKGRAPRTGYARENFGQRWADIDRNGCDQRNDVLARDLTEVEYRPGSRQCIVVSGVLDDPFTGTTIQFTRGETTSQAVQIDHVVALSDAWQKGAQALDADTRERFANDPLNLIAVDGPSNQSKGDGDAATWLPPNKAYRCPYVARQIAVKSTYQLWVTPAERDAMAGVLETCPDEPLPSGATAVSQQTSADPSAFRAPTASRTWRVPERARP